MTKTFAKTISKYQADIKRELEIFFNRKLNKNNPSFFLKTIEKLKEFSLRPAKRIRAILLVCGYLCCGGKDKKNILKTSIFIELIHNFLLIHDDILDQEKLRRGKPALHCSYQKENSLKNNTDKKYYGVSMAVVAGDMMEFLARQILSGSKFPAEFKTRATERLDQILMFTAHGEMFEFWLRKNCAQKTITKKNILEIYKNKTAYYTFVGPLQIGATLAGASKEHLLLLEKIGLPLGIAFQINDDFKDASEDAKQNQPSLLRKKTPEECKKLAQNLIKEAKESILKTNFPQKEKQFLLDLADFITPL